MYTTSSTEETLRSLIIEGYKVAYREDFEAIIEYIKYCLEEGIIEKVQGELLRIDEYLSSEDQIQNIKEFIKLKETLEPNPDISLLDKFPELYKIYEGRLEELRKYLEVINNLQRYVDIL